MKMRSKKIDRVFAVIFALLLLAALLSPIYVENDEPVTVAWEPGPNPVNVNAAGQAGEHVDSAVAWRWYGVP